MKDYPLFKVHLDTEDVLDKLREVFNSGIINEGNKVTELTEKLCKKLNTENLVLVNSCTSALAMSLKLSGVGPGDEVISTSMTCVATNSVVNWLGAKIVWADIDSQTGNIDPVEVESKITEKTKAVICVDWSGIPCKLKKLQNICRKNKIKLIQDAAHAFGSQYNGQPVCHYADYTCYSFQAIKHFTTGDGGAIVCLDDNDVPKARAMKWYGFDRKTLKDKKGNWKGRRWNVDIKEIGSKFNMNNISATMGISNLAHIERIVAQHKSNAKVYNKLFKDNDDLKPLLVEDNMDPAYWIYTVILSGGINRENLIEELKSKGVHTDTVHVPNHPYDCFAESYCKLPQTDYFGDRQLCLPCGWWLNEQDIEDIYNILIDTVDLIRV